MEPDEQNLALSQGLLGLGAGLLSGSFGHYGAMAPALGQGAAGFGQGYGNAMRYNLESQQLKMLQQNYQRQNMMMELATKYLGGGGVGGGNGGGMGGGQQPMVPGTSTSPYVLSPQTQASMQQPQQNQQPPQNQQQSLANLGLLFGIGKMDPSAILAANEQLNPKGAAVREGGMANPYNGDQILPPMLKTVEGLAQRYNPTTKQYEYYKPVGSDLVAQQAGAVAGATTKAKEEVMDPRTPVEVPMGTRGKQMKMRSELLPQGQPNPMAPGASVVPPQGGSFGMTPGLEQETLSKDLATARSGYTNTALAAQESLPSIQLMKTALISGLKTNNLTEYTNGFGGWMKALGIDPTQYGLNDPTNTQEFSKGATKLVADMTRALGGREPFQAMQFVQKGNPGLGNTVDANVKLVALAEGTKLWEIKRDQEAQAWADKHGGTTDGFIQNFQMRNPVQTFWQKSFDELKKQMPDNSIIVKPYNPNGNSLNMGPVEKNYATQPIPKGWSVKEK